MNKLVDAQTNGNLPTRQGGNPFERYADATTQRSIVGKLLKFSKGDFLAGEQADEVPVSTRLVANMDELLIGWIKWQDSRPVEHIMGRVIDEYTPPKRNELGDTDDGSWEVDMNGERRDPWQFNNYLLMKDAKGDQIYTFTTSSRGGLNAIGELSRSYGKAMRQRPNDFPVIELGVGSYQHPNKNYGRIKFPTLAVVGWEPKAVFAEAMAAETSADAETVDSVEEQSAPAPKAATRGKVASPKAQTRF